MKDERIESRERLNDYYAKKVINLTHIMVMFGFKWDFDDLADYLNDWDGNAKDFFEGLKSIFINEMHWRYFGDYAGDVMQLLDD